MRLQAFNLRIMWCWRSCLELMFSIVVGKAPKKSCRWPCAPSGGPPPPAAGCVLVFVLVLALACEGDAPS